MNVNAIHDEEQAHPSFDEKTVRESRYGKSEINPSEPQSRAESPKPELDDFPDGGLRAWLVVLGAACGVFTTFGFVNAWGIFQAYYEQTLLSTTPPSTIAWIGSLQYALVFIPGLIVGRLFDMGYFKTTTFVASCVLVTATFLVAQCTEYWQFLLCQGIAVGLSSGFIFGPMLGIVAHWFYRKKGLALGLVALGSSFGGTIFPIAARNLIHTVGFKWTMRIIGFILLAVLAITNLTLERRLPPRAQQGSFIKLGAFKNSAYSVYCATCFVAFLGLYTVLTYIDVSASAAGISDNLSSYLVAIANASSAIGRMGGGIIADRIGPINVMIPSTLIAAVLTYAWPFAKTGGDFVAIAIIYGIFSGVFVGIIAMPIMHMGDTHEVGNRVGMLFTILAIGALIGPPISGAINTATGGYKFVGIYAGSAILLCVILMLITRYLALRRLWGKF